MFGIKTKLYNPFIAIPMHLSCNLVSNIVSRHSVVGNHQGKPIWVPQFNLGAEWATDWYGFGYCEPWKASSNPQGENSENLLDQLVGQLRIYYCTKAIPALLK
jgi:hypothetical protein